jgi:hypothetical protein
MDIWLVGPTGRMSPDEDLVPGGGAEENAGAWLHEGVAKAVRVIDTIGARLGR